MVNPPRVLMYHGSGAHPEPLEACLRPFGFEVERVSVAQLALFDGPEARVLYLPGGWYSFDEAKRRVIRAFIDRGGGCVGTCAGAYKVAGELALIPGRVLRANMRGRLYIEPQQGDHPLLRGVVKRCIRHSDRQWEPIAMTYLGGPFILPEDASAIVASYDVEGEIGALVAAAMGLGRAVAICGHPELPLAKLPDADPIVLQNRDTALAFQGDASRIIRNAVLWAAGREHMIADV